MADIKSPTERYKAIADAIREKSGTTELLSPADMPQAILDIVSGGGVTYTNIVYNEDDTITLTDKDGVIHTMECEYTDGKLTSVKYDGKAIELTYDGDVLIKVGKTAVNVNPKQEFTLEVTSTFESKRVGDENADLEYRTTATSDIVAFFSNIKKHETYLLSIDDSGFLDVVPMFVEGFGTVLFHYSSLTGVGYLPETNEFAIQMLEDADLSGVHTVVIKNASELTIVQNFQNGFSVGLSSGGVVEVIDTTEIDNLENLIDESGVLEDTEGTVTQKVEELIGKAEELDVFMNITGAAGLFKSAKTFPNKAVVNLPNATTIYQAFSYWNTEPIPIVEELTINAPKINVSNTQTCMGQMFHYNYGVKKVILNMPDGCQHMESTFSRTQMEEIVLNFSTKNIINYGSAFIGSTVKKIIGVLDFSSATSVNSMFQQCDKLEEVTFGPNTLSLSIGLAYSSKLTSESIQSIFDGLATLEEGVTRTLTLPSNAKILQSQVDSANAKGWTVAGGKVVSEEEYYG